MLRTRVVTALLLAPIAIALVAFLPPPLIWITVAPVFGLAAWEWGRLALDRPGQPAGPALPVGFGLAVAAIVALVLPGVSPETAALGAALGLVCWLGLVLWLWRADLSRPARPGLGGLKLAVGAPVLLLAALALGTIFNLDAGRIWLLVLLFVIWGADTGAYFAGKQFGRRKLAPSISPGKTWEGVVGGLLVVCLVCLIGGAVTDLPAGRRAALIGVGLVTACLSIAGDLFASLLKRQAGRKDSSRLLPGHGGVLDRFDSLLAAAPTFSVGLALLGIQR